MNLVDYSSSDSESECEAISPKRIKLTPPIGRQCDIVQSSDLELRREEKEAVKEKALPLPDVILHLYTDRQATPRDNPSQHGGRVRSFAHVDGNWATHVYIPVGPDERFQELMTELLRCLQPLDFQPFPDFHLSLSRTVTIRHHWIEPLNSSLKEGCSRLSGCLCDLTEVALYTNDEKTRTFLSLNVSHEDSDLTDYVKMVDCCFGEYNLPSFYQPPSFHISIGWCLGDVTSQVSQTTSQTMQRILKKFLLRHPDLSVVQAKAVHFRSGKKVFAYPLH